VLKSSFQVQLVEIIQRKGNTSLLVPNENDETPHCLLKVIKGNSLVWEVYYKNVDDYVEKNHYDVLELLEEL
jgi:hypothetical protein